MKEEVNMDETFREIVKNLQFERAQYEILTNLIREGMDDYALLSKCFNLSLKQLMDVKAEVEAESASKSEVAAENAEIEDESSTTLNSSDSERRADLGATLQEAMARKSFNSVGRYAFDKFKDSISLSEMFGLEGNLRLGPKVSSLYPTGNTDTGKTNK
jgi:hypothetical protein